MGFYAQNNDKELIGVTVDQHGTVMAAGPYTAQQIGCLLYANSNMYKRLKNVSLEPHFLNVYFTENKVWMADPGDNTPTDNQKHWTVKDDLTWTSITSYDHNIKVRTGRGGWPNSDHAIVEFQYIHNGKKITHFCAVYSAKEHTIIDSYDGQVKHPGIYGEPVAWAVYSIARVKPVPAPHPSSHPVTPPEGTTSKIITVQHGWGLERIAAAAGRTDANDPNCWQEITTANGGTSWQSFNAHLHPGQQVKVPLQHGHGEGEEQPPLFNPSDIQLDDSKLGLYKAVVAIDVVNLTDPSQKEHLPKGNPVTVAAGFTWYGTDYLLPTFSKSNGSWFAIPANKLKSMKTDKTTVYQKLLVGIGGTIGFLSRNKTRKA